MSDAATLERHAVIGHNSAGVGEMIKAEPAVVYRDETVLPSFIAEIKGEIAALPVDLTTASGRDAIKSLSASISRRKTPIVDAGLALTEGWRKQTTAVNTLKAKVIAEMDALRDEARAPVTAWEAAEEKRKTAIVSALAFFAQAAVVPAGSTIESIDATIERVEAIQIGHEYGDSEARARQERLTALAKLDEARRAIVKADAERAELEKLRAEAQERERQAQEAEAKRLADEAERQLIAATERRATEAAEAKVKEAADAEIAAERRKAEQAEQALADERSRQREAQAAEQRRLDAIAAEDARRQADQEHRGAIMRAAKEALMEHGGISEAAAKKVVRAIVAGTVPAVTLKF
jgi:colicin import membrane protein